MEQASRSQDFGDVLHASLPMGVPREDVLWIRVSEYRNVSMFQEGERATSPERRAPTSIKLRYHVCAELQMIR